MNPEPTFRPSIHVTRVIRSSPAAVYRAWLDPQLIERWLAPGDMQVTSVKVEERVGGHFSVRQAHGQVAAGGFECEIAELVPDERIVFHWGFVGPDGNNGPKFDSLLTVTFSATEGGATSLDLVHDRLDALHVAMPQVADNVELGWTLVLDKMWLLLAKPDQVFVQ